MHQLRSIFGICAIVYLTIYVYITTKVVIKEQDVLQKKVVLYAATKFFGMNITTERFLKNCHSTRGYCRISENPDDLVIADAVLFHNADYVARKVPMPRKSNRPHVLWSLESPTNDKFRPASHVINWTMTYLRDADIWYPYGHFEKLAEPIDVNLDEIWAFKNSSKKAAWLASNCNATNGREKLVTKMQNVGLNIDRWGLCGEPPPNCNGVEKQGHDCVTDLIRPYKFYISLENSNCKDYITEKFYETLKSRMAVPIVLSRKIYEAVGAPGSAFIAMDNFSSIAELVNYINKIANNKEKYLSYHKWRSTHRIIPEHDDTTGFCELCRRLQNPNRGHKSYEDVSSWHSSSMCDNYLSLKYL